jgi:hypothetical protein
MPAICTVQNKKLTALGKHVSQKGSIDVERSVRDHMHAGEAFEEFITVLDLTQPE